MFRLVALTICGLFVAGMLVPDRDGTQIEVSRAEPLDTRPVAIAIREDAEKLMHSIGLGVPQQSSDWIDRMDDSEAVRIAMERGRAIRESREAAGGPMLAPVPGTRLEATDVATLEVTTAVETVSARSWRVTADRVNLRAGPGTGHAVLGQAQLGERLVPLSDTNADWIEVRRSGGSTAWIFARFLSESGA